MALPLRLLVSVDGKRSQCPGPLPTLESLGPSHQWGYKSRVSLQGPPCAHSILCIPHEEVRDKVMSLYETTIKKFDIYIHANYKLQVVVERWFY